MQGSDQSVGPPSRKAEGEEGGEVEGKAATAAASLSTSVVESPVGKPNGTTTSRMPAAAWKRPTDGIISDANNTHSNHGNVADSVMGGAVVWPSLGDACAANAKSPDTKGGPSPSPSPSPSTSLHEHSNYQVFLLVSRFHIYLFYLSFILWF